MVQGKFKSGRFRRVQRKVPGGRTAHRFEEARPKQARCGACGKVLHGIPRFRVSEARHSPKTAKRPERPYGGALCSACMRAKIVKENE